MVLAAGRKRLTTCDAEEDRTLSVFVEQPVAVVPRKLKTIIGKKTIVVIVDNTLTGDIHQNVIPA